MALRHHPMRVSKELERLFFMVNLERVSAGFKPLTRGQFTSKLAKRYLNNRVLIHEDFIKF